ncbi:MAG: hypothetical protein A2284_01310 [Deltaproteobacteria bacterium RIFOXYA12_FULL_61_11]|nr:MAG: hypothetical protein A2284_01310 [Deltaproteobacteria bacterium RIFOXYA12_FULL_61_11]
MPTEEPRFEIQAILNANCKAYRRGRDPLVRNIRERVEDAKSALGRKAGALAGSVGDQLPVIGRKAGKLAGSVSEKKDKILERVGSIHLPEYLTRVHVTERIQDLRRVLQHLYHREREGLGKRITLFLGGDGTIRDVTTGLAHLGTKLDDLVVAYRGEGTINVLARELGIKKSLREYLATISSHQLDELEQIKVPTFKVTGYTSQGTDLVTHGQMFGLGIVPNFLEEYYKDKYNTLRSTLRIVGKVLTSIPLSLIYKNQTYHQFFDTFRMSVNGREYELNFFMFQTLRYFTFFKIFNKVDPERMLGHAIGINAGPVEIFTRYLHRMLLQWDIKGAAIDEQAQVLELDFKGRYINYIINGDNSQLDLEKGRELQLRAKRIRLEVNSNLNVLTGNLKPEARPIGS